MHHLVVSALWSLRLDVGWTNAEIAVEYLAKNPALFQQFLESTFLWQCHVTRLIVAYDSTSALYPIPSCTYASVSIA